MRGVGALILCLAAADPAWADSTDAHGQDATARGHYQTGSAYYEAGDYARAVKEFLEARREIDLPALDYNLGVAYEQLGDAARAIKAYERFLARSPETPQRVTIERSLARLAHRVGHLIIDPPRAREGVLVDGEPQLDGDDRVTEGRHRVNLMREGVAVHSATVRVDAGQSRYVTARQLHASSRWWIGVVVGGVVLSGVAIGLGIGLGTRGSGSLDRTPSLGSLGVP